MTTPMIPSSPAAPSRAPQWLLAAGVAAVLSACGGGSDTADTSPANVRVSAAMASGVTTIQLTPPTLPDAAAGQMALPSFAIAPALLAAPADADASAVQERHQMTVPAEFSRLSPRRLTLQAIQEAHLARASGRAPAADTTLAPMANGGLISTFTPAQIRLAYGLPALPATGSALSATQAAQLGAGQTIYIVDAMNDPNVAAELNAFNTKFGLPACTVKTIAAGATTALPTASATACELSVVYSTSAGAMTATQPAYDAGWATEITLDVQWAHATAPLARIVLIEAASSSLNDLVGAVKVANAMGPGVVSMSFGSSEGSWTGSTDAVFNNPKMSYLAATGDDGAAVSWPAVSPYVLAVGGTTLSYTGSGVRSEVSWSGTGGGTSQFTATPSYQNSSVPGITTLAHRTVADVAFNADPASGQYLAVIASGSSTVNWLSAGGTSLATPQWAGLLAVANAERALAAKPVLGAPHAMLYTQIASVPGTYASVFADVIKGSDGSCAACTAKSGYDQLTGLGTPNVTSLLGALSGLDAKTAPVITPATINGSAGSALSFTVAVLAPNAVTYTLTNAPSGMAISDGGAVTWAAPLAGNYAVTVTAKDKVTGLSGAAVYTIVISAPVVVPPASAPVVAAASITGRVGTPLSFAVSASGGNPLTYALAGAPAGMAISANGTLSWAAPVAGSYAVTVVAKDSKTGLTGQAIITVKISAAAAVSTAGPVITAAAMTGVVGKAFSGTIELADAGATSLMVSLGGMPIGLAPSASGGNIALNWANPVAGNYAIKILVVDNAGLSAQATLAITINAR